MNLRASSLANQWLSGLGVWFLLWVQEVPGSNPGWALVFCQLNGMQEPKSQERGHSDLNQGPTGLQPGALPLSYIPNRAWTVSLVNPNLYQGGKGSKKVLSERGFEPLPSSEDQNSHSFPIWKQGMNLESGALDHSAILTMIIFLCRSDQFLSESILNKNMLQVRFELTTSASLAPWTAYKYGALTDCATGATVISVINVFCNILTGLMINKRYRSSHIDWASPSISFKDAIPLLLNVEALSCCLSTLARFTSP